MYPIVLDHLVLNLRGNLVPRQGPGANPIIPRRDRTSTMRKKAEKIGGGKSPNGPPQPRVRVSPARKCPREPNPTRFGAIAVAYQARSRPACSECGRRYYPNLSGKGRIKESAAQRKGAKRGNKSVGKKSIQHAITIKEATSRNNRHSRKITNSNGPKDLSACRGSIYLEGSLEPWASQMEILTLHVSGF